MREITFQYDDDLRVKAVFEFGTEGDPDVPGGIRSVTECICEVYANDSDVDIYHYLSREHQSRIDEVAYGRLREN